MATLTYRAATYADIPFLVELRRLTMRPHELAIGVNRSAEQTMRRVMQSFDVAQIIEQGEQAVGVLKVVRNAAHWELSQVQLMPALQGRGIGSRIIGSVVSDALAAEVSVRLHVLRANPARKLYQRLGFVVVNETLHGYEMAFGV
ncbi:GNAT family N-acetyltransferase [Casimicrobium huifangae]|jgi:ribosomal protein S18 acetylase RimI-like enzyme|uniref:GNAT family N-acetyltransferase n=1 Tax=Casimicrobium huifangae TaxID=2591109 RepID=UPI0037847A39